MRRRSILSLGLLAGLVAAAAPAAADCTDTVRTVDLGAATVQQYEYQCSQSWGGTGYSATFRGATVASDAAYVNANVGRTDSFAEWGGFGFHAVDREANVQADLGGGLVAGYAYVSHESYMYHSGGPAFCQAWMYVDAQMHPLAGFTGDAPAPCVHALAGPGPV